MIDLRTSYLGLDLSSPLVVSASPLGADLDTLRRLESVGAASGERYAPQSMRSVNR